MIYTLLAIYGLVFGSFFNVVGLRVPVRQSIIWPGSVCPTCGHKLRLYELVPVFSYLFQKGMCRSCKTRIHPIYPIMELSTAFLFVWAYFHFGFHSSLLIALTLISLFVIVTVSDMRYTLIPDKVLAVFLIIFLAERLFFPLRPWWDSLVGFLVGFVLLYLIALVSKGGMGGGDVKLFALIGFVVGWKVFLLSFFLATCIGTIVGIVGMIVGNLNRKSQIPFAPSIAVGTLIAFFYYEPIVNYYLALF